MMDPQNFSPQKTSESCLANTLLVLCGVKPNLKKEIEIISNGLKLSPSLFAIGQLNEVVGNFHIRIDFYVDSEEFLKRHFGVKFSKNIRLASSKIDLKFIDRMLEKSPVVVYTDGNTFWRDLHYPHYVIVAKKTGKGYRIYEPSVGRMIFLSSKKLSKSIVSLRNKIKHCPQLIAVSKLPKPIGE